MIETVTRKRIEILVDTPLVSRITGYAKEAGISGWSIIHVDSGRGKDGSWQHDEVTEAAAKAIILLIAGEEKANALIERLAPLLDSHRLLLTMGEVRVIRGERF